MNEQEIENYVEAFERIKRDVDDVSVAIAILQELGKDGRLARINERNVGNGSNGAEQASAKQRAYLKQLGVEAPANLTKADASKLIDEALAQQ